MYKVKQSSKNITPFGGLNFIYSAIYKKGIDAFLDEKMGARNPRAQYSHSEVILSLLGNALSQGEYLSDLEQFKNKFYSQIFDNIPSPDTVEYVCQELKTETIIEKTYKGVVHEFNYNNKTNETLVALCVKIGLLNSSEKNYILDFDNVVTENEKQDAKKSYKKTNGYHPNFAFIGRLLVHLENHNGNTPAKYKQKETLERCFANLASQGIHIEHFRADSASYQKDVVDLVSQKATNFYIRIIDSPAFREHCGKIDNWETIKINHEKKEVATTNFAPFKGAIEYRIVVTRALKKDAQLDLFSESAYNYFGIMTNNIPLCNKEVIEFYNDRGDAENSNRYLLNDFNVHHLPFPDMDTNTVFMYLMAMCSILFEWIKTILVKNKTPKIKLNMRVKAVFFRYVSVATQFINHAREKVLQVFSAQNYMVLQI